MHFKPLLCIVAFFATQLFAPLEAQNTYPSAHYHPFRLGIAPISTVTLIGKFNVCAEWVYKPNRSIGLLVSVPVNNIPRIIGWEDINSREMTSKHNFTALNIVLENRRYQGNTGPTGLYWAPYLRYLEYHVWKRDSIANTESNYLYSNKVKGVGAGVACGVQFRLAHYFTIDITFLALDFKLVRGYQLYETDYKDPNYGTTLIKRAANYWSDLPIYHFKVIENDLQGNSLRTRTNLKLIPGYRANITIKLAFGKSVPLAVKYTQI